MIQDEVWSVSIVLMGFVAAIFAWVAIGSREALTNYGPVIESAYRLRTWLLLIAVLILIWGNYKTLAHLPYVSSRSPQAAAAVTRSNVVAEQWSWSIKPDHFVVGQTAEFHVTSKDVNHGFAIYDPNMRIVAQTQAMPGYTNVLRYTFTEAGTYRVLCLEYCGAAHHVMAAGIKVTIH
jgi:cytochrome c oxidase subunit 2